MGEQLDESLALLSPLSDRADERFKAFLAKCEGMTDLVDFTIRCGDREWKVHRLVIAPQSDFLNRAAMGPFKEGISRELDLSHHENPETIDRAIRFLYHQDYDDSRKDYDKTEAMIGSIEPPSWPLTVNAEVFALAEELGIHALKHLAISKTLEVFGGKTIWFKDLGRAVMTIYGSTPASERIIRVMYVKKFQQWRASIFAHRHCEELMADFRATNDFLVDVIRADTEKPAKRS